MLSKFLLTAVAAIPAGATAIKRDAPNCFPYGSATLPANLQVPNVPRDQWWCPQSMAYGFQGFSYPLENGDCNAPENGYDAMNADFAQMKRDFGANIIRMYYPVCTQASVFQNALEAAAANNMAIIFQVWTNFGDGDAVWQASQQAIYDVLNDPKYSAIAPYIVHSAEFGSEPVGDGMGGSNFVNDLASFHNTVKPTGIPVGISEDWDRPGTMSDGGDGLGPVGQGVKDNSDVAHMHPMPFYHGDNPVDAAWPYIQQQTQWVVDHVQLPTMISETQWAWGETDHNPGKSDVGPQQYITYWTTIDNNCEWFRDRQVGWFFHSWRGEGTFDIVKPDGSYAIPNWRPRRC